MSHSLWSYDGQRLERAERLALLGGEDLVRHLGRADGRAVERRSVVDGQTRARVDAIVAAAEAVRHVGAVTAATLEGARHALLRALVGVVVLRDERKGWH